MCGTEYVHLHLLLVVDVDDDRRDPGTARARPDGTNESTCSPTHGTSANNFNLHMTTTI